MPDKPLQKADMIATLKDMVARGDASGSEASLALTAATGVTMAILGERSKYQKQFDAPSVSHTPKPWRLRLHDLTGECDIVAMEEVEDKDGETIGEVVIVPTGVFSVADPVSLANGRLMAAAPKVLAACRQVKEAQVADGQSEYEHNMIRALRVVEAAIAEAEGVA